MTAGGAAAAAELPLCPVCTETLGRWGGPCTLPCGHNGCLDCLVQVQGRNAQCPLCRAHFGKDFKLSANHELEDLIRLATMIFVDENAQQDGWEAFPTQQVASDSYAADLIRGQQRSMAHARAPPSHTTSSHPHARTSEPSGVTYPHGHGHLDVLPDLDILTRDPISDPYHHQPYLHDPEWQGHHYPSAPSLSSLTGPGPSDGGAGPSSSFAHAHTHANHHPPQPHHASHNGTWHVGHPLGGHGGAGGVAMAGRVGPMGAASGSLVLTLEPPLWLPDSHASDCLSCHMPFRPFTRLRHHCRLCGKIFCSACCHKKALLPPKFGVRTPQRVCELCATALGPHQQLLAGTLAAAAQPPVQDSPDAISLRAWVNPPWTTALDQDIFKAANILSTFVKAVHLPPEAGLPTAALQGAEGLALLTVVKVGAGWSFTFGTGLVVARTPGGDWSAPCAVSAAGMGWGLQLGGELADVLLVLRSREALAGLCGGLRAGVAVGGTAAVALGPVGRHADASVVLNATGSTAAYGYSCTRGAFLGVSVESLLLCVREQVNLNFYGYPATPRQLLLEGTVPQPPAAGMLYEGIKALLNRFECRRRLVHSRHSAQHRPHQHQQQPRIQQRQQQQPLALPAAPSPAAVPLAGGPRLSSAAGAYTQHAEAGPAALVGQGQGQVLATRAGGGGAIAMSPVSSVRSPAAVAAAVAAAPVAAASAGGAAALGPAAAQQPAPRVFIHEEQEEEEYAWDGAGERTDDSEEEEGGAQGYGEEGKGEGVSSLLGSGLLSFGRGLGSMVAAAGEGRAVQRPMVE